MASETKTVSEAEDFKMSTEENASHRRWKGATASRNPELACHKQRKYFGKSGFRTGIANSKSFHTKNNNFPDN